MLNKIISMFEEKDSFVSGEKMSKKLGITRAAVWKKIQTLRGKGYKIQASQAKGYKLIDIPEFSVEELRILIKGDIGREIIFLENTDSTNNIAMEFADKGALHGTVAIADAQTRGKGRLGRAWVSPPKSNIYMSVILRPAIEPKDATLLTVMSGVACTAAIRRLTGLQVKIKWPNDLMVSDKKLGGILTEIKSDPDRIIFAVIGIGINVNIRLNAFPSEIQSVATSIRRELGKAQSRTFLIAEILKEIERWYEVLISAGKKTLLEEWKQCSSTLGKKVKVIIGKETLSGTAENIDAGGMLMLRLPSGILKKVSSGDLTILR